MGLSHTGLGLDPSLESAGSEPWPSRELIHHFPQGRMDHQNPAISAVSKSALMQLPCWERRSTDDLLLIGLRVMQIMHMNGRKNAGGSKHSSQGHEAFESPASESGYYSLYGTVQAQAGILPLHLPESTG